MIQLFVENMGGGGVGVGTVDYAFKVKYFRSDSLTVITNYIIYHIFFPKIMSVTATLRILFSSILFKQIIFLRLQVLESSV